ncbi:MAG TPA: hypothetical protein VHS97_19980 [Isosphaeraceae bacterium]|nr:hypothetical protein [Isosphaeraceae bacterium]
MRSFLPARVALLARLWAKAVTLAGHGPPVAGSVRLSEGLNLATGPCLGPGRATASPQPLGPGKFRVEPKTKSGRRRGG